MKQYGVFEKVSVAGILAGDSQANAFAKSVLYYVVAKVHEDRPSAGPVRMWMIWHKRAEALTAARWSRN